MRLSTLVQAAVLSLALPFAAHGAKHEGSLARRHHNLALQARGEFDNARFTFYDVGLGACGLFNSPSDFIVALNSVQFDESSGYPAKNCFRMVTIEVNGKTAQAQITDECPGCPDRGLDFSRGLFDHFASEDAGVLNGKWWFNDDAPAAPAPPKPTPTPPPPPPPPPKPTPTPEPTTTWTPPPPPPKPTTTWTPPPPPETTSEKPKPEPTPSSSSEEHSSSSSVEHFLSFSSVAPSSSPVHSSSATPSSSSSSVPVSVSVSVSSSAPAAAPTTDAIDQVYQAVLGLTGLAAAAAAAGAGAQ
ncbi:RlpA-like double-psi beta-barrel-protein domain-containing protein-containing protein [Irpex rosettiformis]|uniref:RlpA-like double-psi beta-barrel-protein domain-containing protein-containing protein n=1 Tax=Irpex rosettiformis TaxID=378272 RepID=A0ACB8TWB1_9APHY|nr:RlpA-like double-psi beta-barrel-protein domain-containing protein-containing protein [Irpex rosettiformis]